MFLVFYKHFVRFGGYRYITDHGQHFHDYPLSNGYTSSMILSCWKSTYTWEYFLKIRTTDTIIDTLR